MTNCLAIEDDLVIGFQKKDMIRLDLFVIIIQIEQLAIE